MKSSSSPIALAYWPATETDIMGRPFRDVRSIPNIHCISIHLHILTAVYIARRSWISLLSLMWGREPWIWLEKTPSARRLSGSLGNGKRRRRSRARGWRNWSPCFQQGRDTVGSEEGACVVWYILALGQTRVCRLIEVSVRQWTEPACVHRHDQSR
jgi:hypothetical protein